MITHLPFWDARSIVRLYTDTLISHLQQPFDHSLAESRYLSAPEGTLIDTVTSPVQRALEYRVSMFVARVYH